MNNNEYTNPGLADNEFTSAAIAESDTTTKLTPESANTLADILRNAGLHDSIDPAVLRSYSW